MQLHENTVLSDKYKLIRQLGQGGFSEVWLADDIVARIQVAVKIYNEIGGELDDDEIYLFGQEFSRVFSINHNNLLKPINYDTYNRVLYIVMPYCMDGSVYELVGGVNEDTVWRILHDIAAALAYLHSLNPPVIHQNIRPDNILVGGNGNYLITDLVIGNKAQNILRKSGLSTCAVRLLKPDSRRSSYVVPERRFSVDPMPIMASDIWSLGATMFELITKKTPFGEYGGFMQRSGAAIPNINGNWSDGLKKVVRQCLAKDPWDRPMAKDLFEYAEQYLSNENGI